LVELGEHFGDLLVCCIHLGSYLSPARKTGFALLLSLPRKAGAFVFCSIADRASQVQCRGPLVIQIGIIFHILASSVILPRTSCSGLGGMALANFGLPLCNVTSKHMFPICSRRKSRV